MMKPQSKTNFSLRTLSPNDGEEIHQMLQEIPKEERGFNNMFHGLDFSDFKKELVLREKESRGENLAEDRVPQTIYWFYVDGVPTGIIKIRHYLNDFLRQYGGHIGYAIVPKYRGKGYGSKMLELALVEARKLGVKDILLVCDPDNFASKGVIINNGGELEKETEKDALYWIRERVG